MPDERQAAVTTHGTDRAVVVRVKGDIDHDSAPLLAEALGRASREGAPRTVVDLSRTSFVDSSILHVLLETQQSHRRTGTVMVVAGPLGDSVRRLFDVTGTTEFFLFADDVPAALEAPGAVTEP
ncbi:STAS domain-containing protein [Streptomyces fructofermentans]|uniref:Anti-sigma factor antagonist n=1 Tax=Streptomyces fructofermentans TaxID=152141 RepID=A0A918NPA7_9ACTN|nr:STAS domain-containing protein [Streptomyces fructofermentans]GGX85139.1 hypothetical protein GCM10010515_60730 [Streptomyces fructofermentans]